MELSAIYRYDIVLLLRDMLKISLVLFLDSPPNAEEGILNRLNGHCVPAFAGIAELPLLLMIYYITAAQRGGDMRRGATDSGKYTKSLILLFFLAASGILVPLAVHAQDTITDDMLTLKQAIEIALKNQPLIEAQQGMVSVGKAKTGQAMGNYYPHITLGSAYATISPVQNRTSATTSISGLPPDSNIPTGLSGMNQPNQYSQYSATGNLHQLLFDFGKTPAQVKAQDLSTEAAGYELANVQEQVIYNVKEAYYSLLNARRNRDAVAGAVEQFRKHLEYARGLYETGTKPRFDVTKAEVDLSNAEVDLIKAENSMHFYRFSLNNALGMQDSPSYEVEEEVSIETAELSFEEAMEKAFRQRPDLASLQKQDESANESINVARRGRYPTLNGTASYTYVATDFPLDHGWTAGVNMVFPLFTGFVLSNQVAEAQANLTVIMANKRNLKQKIILELEQAFLSLKESAQRMNSTEVAVRQARENLELALERYSSGLAIAVEMTDAIVSYTNAQMANSTAHYDHMIAQARIAKAIGGE